jgi:hypothetical protein
MGMSIIKMGPVITQIKGEAEKPSLPRRFLNFVLFQAHKVSWALWGRRRAFAKMQRLALGERQLYSDASQGPSAVGIIKAEQERITNHRMHLNSLVIRERLPPPDVDDSGTN